MADRPLDGKVALVAGATRGAGRGIACMLGAAGAVVYCTGRTGAGQASPMARPETIEETAALVDGHGGQGVAVRTDHTREEVPVLLSYAGRTGDLGCRETFADVAATLAAFLGDNMPWNRLTARIWLGRMEPSRVSPFTTS